MMTDATEVNLDNASGERRIIDFEKGPNFLATNDHQKRLS